MTIQKELLHLGEILRKKREEKTLSLKEIENATSIRSNFLAAIEEGEMQKLISPIYAQGFIKKYAAFLEFDPESIFKEHPLLHQALSQPSLEPQEYSLGLGAVEMRGNPTTERKGLSNFMWVALSAVGILTIWFLARYLDII